ncbi:ADAM metallopeptidase with thrombospondin type 1, motif [Didymella keratinophila]|nr:ADAM metallopeptidase with thrombospondin type 1, motif [Didymella keratinophila]
MKSFVIMAMLLHSMDAHIGVQADAAAVAVKAVDSDTLAARAVLAVDAAANPLVLPQQLWPRQDTATDTTTATDSTTSTDTTTATSTETTTATDSTTTTDSTTATDSTTSTDTTTATSTETTTATDSTTATETTTATAGVSSADAPISDTTSSVAPTPSATSSDSSAIPSGASSTGLVDADPISATSSPAPSATSSDSSAIPSGASSTGLVDADPISATSSVVPTSSAVPGGSLALPIGTNPYDGPYPPGSPYDPNSPYYDPTAQPPGWEGEDNGIYDGEDNDAYPGQDNNDDEECPAWCIPEDNSYPTSTYDSDYSPYQPTPTEYETTPAYTPYPNAYPTPTPDYEAAPQYYPQPDQSYPQLKKVRSVPHAVRRQSQYSDDDDSGEYDGEDGSIPDWLYDISGAPARPTYSPKPKPRCPKSCYKPKTSAGYPTKPGNTYPEPTTDAYYPGEATDAPYADYTSSVYYSADNSSAAYWPAGPTNIPDEPTSVPYEPTAAPYEPTAAPYEPTAAPYEPTAAPYEPTAAPYEPTTLATYYQPAQSYPQQTGGSDPGSPAGDYTGDTLDTICPSTCNPFNPSENFCDVTTGCTTTGGSKYYCACRAGFRADGYNAKDFSKQFKVAGQPYVYLAVSTSCNTPCSDQTCSEVLERSQCM